jgi:hypothetical protein
MFYFILKISRSGYLNVQLSHDEMRHVLTHQEKPEPCTWTNPGYLNIEETGGKTFKPYHDFKNNVGEDGSRRLWQVVHDGLKLFGIKEEHVSNIVGIRLAIRYSKNVIFELNDVPGPDGLKERWGFLVGDAAFQTHFWPGRGLNSAFKEIATLAWCLTDKFAANNRLRRTERIHINYFESYMRALREREHRFRSLIFLCGISMIKHVDNAVKQQEIDESIKILIDRIIESRNIFIRRRNGVIPANRDLSDNFKELDIYKLLLELKMFSINVMANTGGWPQAPGEEILPRDFIGQNRFLLPTIPKIKYSKPNEICSPIVPKKKHSNM